MVEKLSYYLPKENPEVKIELWDELSPVVERISQVLPPEVLWDLFSSSPTQTGGRIVFPYCRVDNAVMIAGDYSYMFEEYGKTLSESNRWYQAASAQAFKALVWVEIGFEGLENLAKSKASVNWTTAVGHFVDDEQRATRIMTTGKEMYEECLRQFVSFRRAAGVSEDLFTQYGVEYLLEGPR